MIYMGGIPLEIFVEEFHSFHDDQSFEYIKLLYKNGLNICISTVSSNVHFTKAIFACIKAGIELALDNEGSQPNLLTNYLETIPYLVCRDQLYYQLAVDVRWYDRSRLVCSL